MRKTEIREVAVVSHDLQQRGAAEAGDLKLPKTSSNCTVCFFSRWHRRFKDVTSRPPRFIS